MLSDFQELVNGSGLILSRSPSLLPFLARSLSLARPISQSLPRGRARSLARSLSLSCARTLSLAHLHALCTPSSACSCAKTQRLSLSLSPSLARVLSFSAPRVCAPSLSLTHLLRTSCRSACLCLRKQRVFLAPPSLFSFFFFLVEVSFFLTVLKKERCLL